VRVSRLALKMEWMGVVSEVLMPLAGNPPLQTDRPHVQKLYRPISRGNISDVELTYFNKI
jgi:hypothetical protein